MNDKPLGPVLCLHCGNDKAERLPGPGDYSDYRCPTCGEYGSGANRPQKQMHPDLARRL